MGNSTKYWKGIEELETPLASSANDQNEFGENIPMDEVFSGSDVLSSNRRDFLKYFGFSVSAVALAACNKAPVKYAIPYVEKPENVTPGVALYYATNCNVYNEGFPIVAKVREGRPIKLDGNEMSELSQGGLCATGQASILSLYDTNRFANPRVNGEEQEDWAKVDTAVAAAIRSANGKGIRLVSRSVSSPLMQKAIDAFKNAHPNTEHVVFDPVSYSGITKANEKNFGQAVVPSYHFDKADVIVSFAADFLGTWISPVKFQADYSKNRSPRPESPTMSKHYQIESLMSVTGTNADNRYPMAASKHGAVLATLYNKLASKLGGASMNVPPTDLAGNSLDKIAKDLLEARGKSLVVSGSNDVAQQEVVNAINNLLGNYGSTIDINKAVNLSSYSEEAFDKFNSELKSGSVGLVIDLEANPVYAHAGGSAMAEALKNTTVISTSMTPTETSELAAVNAPNNHFLESWDVMQPVSGTYTITQPVMSKVFNTRSSIASLHAWANAPLKSEEGDVVYEALKAEIASLGGDYKKAIHDGYFNSSSNASATAYSGDLSSAAAAISSSKADGLELVLYQKVGPKDGTWSLNPWCHELPDPVTKVTYDNYVTVSMTDAVQNLKLEQGDFVKVTTANGSIEKLPVLIQPGQARGTIGIAVGYGRKLPASVKNDLRDLGQNAYPLAAVSASGTSYEITSGVSIEKVGSGYEFAQTQTHHSVEGRDYMREATLGEYKKNHKVRNEHSAHLVSLWDEHNYSTGHHWGMAIDMNACTGCGSCIVSCSIENNVPPVGRDEVRRRREMHWLRIDRYYSFGDNALTKEDDIDALTDEYNDKGAPLEHYENVRVTHQAVMCQHCDHAPCETVCPVLATTHSTEGLNQMTYNRCIGTKYCANNCPYKVRRFNWFRYNLNPKFDYHFNNELGRMVLNPDVTVRSRGVMEKCSFCVQNIQMAKLKAKRENRSLEDGDVSVACAKACPSNAIVFGDRNDPNSEISKLYRNERSYKMLEEIDVKPSVVYMTKIRNIDSKEVQHS